MPNLGSKPLRAAVRHPKLAEFPKFPSFPNLKPCWDFRVPPSSHVRAPAYRSPPPIYRRAKMQGRHKRYYISVWKRGTSVQKFPFLHARRSMMSPFKPRKRNLSPLGWAFSQVVKNGLRVVEWGSEIHPCKNEDLCTEAVVFCTKAAPQRRRKDDARPQTMLGKITALVVFPAPSRSNKTRFGGHEKRIRPVWGSYRSALRSIRCACDGIPPRRARKQTYKEAR